MSVREKEAPHTTSRSHVPRDAVRRPRTQGGAPLSKRSKPSAPTRSSHTVWTPANIVTCIRVVFIPFWLALAEYVPASNGKDFSGMALVVALFYMAIALTDKLDGYLARSRNEVTTFGKFLDPIADKLVVLVALCFLLEQQMVWSWVLLIVIAREFLFSGLRMVVASGGVVVAASELGKWKTAVTMIAITGLLFVRCLPAGILFNILITFSNLMLLAAVVLTAWSCIDYFAKSWRYLIEEQ